MFLCQYDGELHDNTLKPHNITFKQLNLQNIPKEISIEVCYNCYGIVNSKYIAGDNNSFIIEPKDKIKIYKISSSTFENKDVKDDEKSEKKAITDILTKMKSNIRKNSKKS
jgi:hypothetical protein